MSIAKVEECIYTSYYIYFKFSHGLIFYFTSYIKRLFYFCSRIFLTEMQKNMIIEQTEDGIPTLYLPRMDEHYHSTKGALAEARHVYIDSALRASGKKEINVLEIGFGTGLNTFLTFLESQEKGLRINYTTFELYPLPRHNRKIELPGAHSPKLRIDICSFTSMRMESKDRYITLVFLIQTPCRPHPNLSRRNIRRGLFRCVRSRKATRNVGRENFPGDFQSLVSGWYSEHLLCERGNKTKASICRVYGRTVTRPAER